MTHLDPEVIPMATRRRFTVRYKKSIVQEASECTEHGEIEKLLRREGLYTSHLARWRRLFESGDLDQPETMNAINQYAEELEAENEALRDRLKKAQTVIDFQKKLCDLLDLSITSSPSS